MTVNVAARRCPRAGARMRRSRTMSDFEACRSRDSASMSLTSAAGSRTVSVFIRPLYYAPASYEIHSTATPQTFACSRGPLVDCADDPSRPGGLTPRVPQMDLGDVDARRRRRPADHSVAV